MKKRQWLIRPIVVAVGSCFVAAPAWANPTGPQVVQGNVQIQGLGTSHVKVTNSPNSIIHWQGFSIGAGQVTQFQQQSSASAVLNRVVGPDISTIQGSLLSNGKVFLINPAGIIVGPGGVIDTAGFVGSTLNMLDSDFLAGRLRFQGDAGAGPIVNEGWIKAARGGNVVLIAPNVQNSGVVETKGGDIILAAGQKMTIGSPRLEGVQFEVQAPADSAVNVGKLIAEGGAVGVFAGTLRHSGDIRATALARDDAGRVVLRAQNETIVAGDATISADSAEGKGGRVAVLGGSVSLLDRTTIGASGAAGGGEILIGGDYQGGNPLVPNASRTFVGPAVTLTADATRAGDGGKVIVWADEATRFHGALSARGGAAGGNGGFAEVSGKKQLVFTGSADLGAGKGAAGTLLLDPLDLYISESGGSNTSLIDEASDVPGNAVTISPDALAAISGNVILHAGRYLRFNSPVNLTKPGQSLTATVAEWTPTDPAGALENLNLLYIGADITTAGGAVSFTAPRIATGGEVTRTIATNGGAISLTATRGAISGPLDLNAGTGAVTVFAPRLPIPDTDPQQFEVFSVSLGNVTGGSFNVSIAGDISTGNITTSGPVSLTSAEQGISTGDVISGPGNVTFNAKQFASAGSITTTGGGVFLTSIDQSVRTNDVTAGGGNVSLISRSGVNTGMIDTTGSVNLLATQGNIFAGVNNAASLTASASRTDGNSVQLNLVQTAATPLNASSLTATATGGCGFFSCPGATVNISATGPVNVGTISASAPVSPLNNTNALVRIDSLQGSILPMTAASKVTAVDVALVTGSPGGLTPELGGSVGTAALPLNVDAKRTFTMRAGREFDVLFGPDQPNQLVVDLGAARMGQTYAGNLRHAGTVLLSASATDSTVTLMSLPTTGFNQRVFNAHPLLAVNVPNGALNVPAVTVPEGDTMPVSETYTTARLDVTLSASNNITVGSYTRASSPASLSKSTTITSQIGSIGIGTLNGNMDDVALSAPSGVTISPTSLTTQGNVSVSSLAGALDIGRITSGGNVSLTSTAGNIGITQIDARGNVSVSTAKGNITVNRIDTSVNTLPDQGAVSLQITCVTSAIDPCGNSPAIVGAAADNTAFEVRSGASVSVTATTIGASGFANPLDLKSAANSSITLSSPNAGGRIGFANAAAPLNIPIVAETPDLTILAGSTTGTGTGTAGVGASFNVSTGSADLQRLAVAANPAGLAAAGQPSAVRTNARVYTFDTAAGDTVVGIPGGTVGAAEFTTPDARFSVSTQQGGIQLNTGVNVNNAQLALSALGGSVTTQNITGRGVALAAGTANDPGRGTAVTITTGTLTATEDVSAVAGRNSDSSFQGIVPRAGRISTGAIEGRDVSLTAFGVATVATPAIRISDGVAPQCIGCVTPARNVTLTANPASANNTFSATGGIEVGNIFARNITTTSFNTAYTVGNLSATGDENSTIQLQSRQAITTGTLDAPVIHIRQSTINADAGTITTGAIGTTMAGRPKTLNLRSNSTITTGPVTLDQSVADTVDLRSNNLSGAGQITIGTSGASDALIGGDGSTINVVSRGSNPFTFSRISAGDTGTVNINSDIGIRQTADTALDGITAKSITLTTGTRSTMGVPRAIDNSADGMNGQLDLRNASQPIALTLTTGGPVALNANAAVLSDLTMTRNSPTASGLEAQPFTLAGLGAGASSQTVNIGGSPNLALEVTSPSKLNLSLTHSGGTTGRSITLSGSGVRTSGGNVTLISFNGPIDGSTGGINTGGAEGGGSVQLTTSIGGITTGAIDTRPTGTGNSGFIFAQANCSPCNILVNGNLDTGAAATTGTITLNLGNFQNGSILGDGVSTIRSGANTVSIFTSNGNIGSPGTPLSISAPTVTLNAQGSPLGDSAGNVFAQLTGTADLTLRGDNGFNVSSSVALNRLVLSTRGSGLGTAAAGRLNLSAPGQTYAFARSDTAPPDPPDQFQVLSASRATPADGLTTASFTAIDGDLVVAGGAALNATNLTLATNARDILVTGPVTISNTSLVISSARDVLITGAPAFNQMASQTFNASRNLTVQAQGGSAVLSAPSQTFTGINGNVSFLGGAGADESVTVSATTSQTVTNSVFSAGGLNLTGGSGDRSFVSMLFGGTGTQTVAVGGSVNIMGGAAPGTGSYAEIRATSGNALSTQSIRANGNINLTGGQGTNAVARIVNTSTNPQQVGESSFFTNFNTDNIALRAGKAGSSAEITSAGRQRILVNSGTLTMRGGDGADAYARIESTSTITQELGTGLRIPSIDMEGGSAAGTSVEILATGSQTVFVNGLTQLKGGSGAGAHALIRSSAAASQTLDSGNLTLLGGSAQDAYARINTAGTQSIDYSAATLTAGTAPGTFALIDAGGVQTISGGDITLRGAGVPPAGVAAGNAGAGFRGHSQTVSAGFIQMFGGSGTSGQPSDVGFENLSGDQSIFANQISMNGGAQFARVGILNPAGAGAQTVSTFAGISLNGAASGAGADVAIDNAAATTQTISASGGSVLLANTGGGAVAVNSAGKQLIDASAIEVTTAAASTGSSTIVAADTQFLRTTGAAGLGPSASLLVSALGTGTASVQSSATQLLEIDYLEVAVGQDRQGSIRIGSSDAGARGTSLVQGRNQGVFARALRMEGSDAAGMSSKLTAAETQAISVLDGETRVRGGTSANAVTAIDPTVQTIVANGNFLVRGGSGAGATAQVASAGMQQIYVTKGTAAVEGGAGAGSAAAVQAAGAQTFVVADALSITGGSDGAGATAGLFNTSGPQSVSFGSLALTANAGGAASVTSVSAQTLTGGAGAISLTAAPGANASIEGHSQALTCTACTFQLAANGAGSAQLVNLSGAQSVSAGGIALLGGQSSTAAIRNQGTGNQTITASAGILLQSSASAATNASVLIENTAASAQIITAAQDLTLVSSGGGTVAVTSGGTQSIDARGLDVQTAATAPGGANATVQASGDQSIHTRGELAAQTGVGMRVASLSTGTAKVVAGGNQTLAIDGKQLLIGRLAFGPAGNPGPSASTQGSPAAGDSLVLATSAAADPNQTVTANSIWIQGPTGNDRVSKLSGDGTQMLTFDRLHLIGGSGQNAFAQIDPTTQTLTGTGDMVIQGGTGSNADALINATGPQTVTSSGGSITLIGGSGPGADALIVTTSSSQTVSAANGVILIQGPAGGGLAGLQQAAATGGVTGTQIVSNAVTSEILREQGQLEELREGFLTDNEQQPGVLQPGGPRKASLCN